MWRVLKIFGVFDQVFPLKSAVRAKAEVADAVTRRGEGNLFLVRECEENSHKELRSTIYRGKGLTQQRYNEACRCTAEGSRRPN